MGLGPDLPDPVASRPAGSRRRGTTLLALAIVAVLAGSALFLSGWALGRQAALTPGTPTDEAAAFQPFWDAYRAVTQTYAGGPVDRKAVIDGAIKGMIAALDDPFSFYLTPEEYKASLQGLAGEFEGIGATMGTETAAGELTSSTPLGPDCRLVVDSTIAGSPAEGAGLVTGDIVTRIDGATVDGLTADAALAKVRGAKDTAVTLTIVRGSAAPLDVEMVRKVIVQPEVATKVLANGTVGYIKLSAFSDHSATDFDAAVAADVAAGRKGLIVDLRGDGGGYVTAAQNVASQFLADGTVFYQADASSRLTEVRATAGGAATDPGIRLVLLVDGNTASASEIVAAALHDRGRATLVGTKTYGKGTMQIWTLLDGDNGGFRLTTGRWLTPKQVWIHGAGIWPDVVVTATPTQPGDDPVLDAGLKVLAGG